MLFKLWNYYIGVTMVKYNKDMTISEIVFSNFKTIEVLKKYGLNCIGCLGAETETLEDVARTKGIDLDRILNDLNNIEKENACV